MLYSSLFYVIVKTTILRSIFCNVTWARRYNTGDVYYDSAFLFIAQFLSIYVSVWVEQSFSPQFLLQILTEHDNKDWQKLSSRYKLTPQQPGRQCTDGTATDTRQFANCLGYVNERFAIWLDHYKPVKSQEVKWSESRMGCSGLSELNRATEMIPSN